MSRLSQKISLGLLSLWLMLVFLEGFIRIFRLAADQVKYYGKFRLVENLNLVYEFIPGAEVDGSVINPQGFKDTPFVREKGKAAIRIAMLGDSITQGIQIPQGKTFSDLLEALLNKEALKEKLGRQYEVMNFGICGYNLSAEVEILKTKVIPYAPDIVILNYYYNDSDPIPGYHMFFIDKNTQLNRQERIAIIKKYYSPSPLARLFKKIFKSSQLYLFVLNRMNNCHENIFDASAFFKKRYGDIIGNII